MRHSRFSFERLDARLIPSKRDRAILALFDDYTLLPANWIYALVKRDFPETHYVSLRARLKALTKTPYKYLSRFTFNGSTNVNETMTFWRTPAGERLLYPAALPNERNPAKDAHQVLLDLLDASVDLGAGESLRTWSDVLAHPQTPESIKTHPTPFRLKIGDANLTPDGRPFVLKGPKGSIAFFKEMDRHTEPLTYSKTRSSIAGKLRLYDQVWKAGLYKSQYGFRSAMLLFVTTNEPHMKNIMELTEKTISKPSWILFKTIYDHTTLGKTHPVSDRFYDEPWLRVGHPPFSLKTLEAVS